ncbi:MAG: hypothetical protein ACLP9L_26525 [Thermoguttaceae bacterium]
MTCAEGEKVSIRDLSQTPFVTGITAVESGKADPHIVVLEEGTLVEVTVAGRQPGGATVDVTVEQSQIGKVKIKAIGPNTSVQIPDVDIHKKRAIDFVKFGEPMVIPLAAKVAGETMPRVELVIGRGEEIKIPRDWTGPAGKHARTTAAPERSDVLNDLLATGTTTIRCEKVSRWEKFRDRTLYDELGNLPEVWGCAESCLYLPHRAGILDVPWLVSITIMDHRDRLEWLEETVLGHDWAYSVELTVGPTLPSALLLGGLPEVWNLRVISKDFNDYPLMHFVTKVNVRHKLELVPCGAAEAEIVKADWLQQRWYLRHDGPGYATLELEASAQLYVEEAESAIPALKAAANLKHVLIIAVGEANRDHTERVQAVLKKALPQADIQTVVFTGGQRVAKATRRCGDHDASGN